MSDAVDSIKKTIVDGGLTFTIDSDSNIDVNGCSTTLENLSNLINDFKVWYDAIKVVKELSSK